jgi:multiple sugar transport system substrate-binding protein
VPDLQALIADDAQAMPRDKYKIFTDVMEWTTNVGYPGYTNAAEDEIFHSWVISNMFARAAAGKATPEEALDQTDKEVQRIFQKWATQRKV